MLKHPKITDARLKIAIDRQLRPLLYVQSSPVTVEKWDVGGEPVPYAHAVSQCYTPFAVGKRWGGAWDTTWFKLTTSIPANWAGCEEVVLRMNLGPNPTWGEGFTCEGLVWRDGKPDGAINIHRDDVLRIKNPKGGETIEVFVEAAANIRPENTKEGTWNIPTDFGGEPKFILERCELAQFNRAAWHLLIEFEMLVGLLEVLPENTPRCGQGRYALNAALNTLGEGGSQGIAAARELLKPILEKHNGDTTHIVSAVGHAHIDTAWLWPLRETIRKCARTFSTALNYMDEYPDYIFACSQPVQYAWMKQHYPEIYTRIKAAVKRGQWQVMGSMWVEPDCNLASGESLVRQLIHGKRFFQDEFGIETTDLWIPDVFGYCAAMPQLMKQAGITSFLTQKISWNQFNRFPHHTFNWRGIDGTEIFTHFPPADTYNGDFSAKEIAKGSERFLEHDRATRSLYPFGYGDGGGGPTREMLERAKMMEDLEGLPRVQIEPTTAFYEKAKEDAIDLPTWVGELYLEYHRGTYTTQGRTKRSNRKCELALRDAEFFDAMDTALNGCAKPQAAGKVERAVYDVFDRADGDQRGGRVGALDRAWKLLLLNQFHDILPGSSIQRVYEDASRDYETISELTQQVHQGSLTRIAASLRDAGELPDETAHTTMSTAPALRSRAAIVFNTLGHARREVIESTNSELALVEVPSCGYSSRIVEPTDRVTVNESAKDIMLANGSLRITIDKTNGHLSSVIDFRTSQSEREVLAVMPGYAGNIQGNVFQLHHDLPNQWDAWDVDVFYREQVDNIDALDAITVIEDTELRAKVRITRTFRNSTINQTIILRADSTRLDFETCVDWQERHRFLKVAFPVAIRSEKATYDIQFGHVERPTHDNTSWDLARFEVCAHKWADLSEGGPASAGGYGVALLNDCKYGYDIRDNVMRLSLLRGPIEPDPTADLGEHIFTYSLFPHPGDFREGRVIEEAYNLNVPLVQWGRHSGLPSSESRTRSPGESDFGCAEGRQECLPHRWKSWLALDTPGIVIEAVKVAEDGDGIIVRMYEAYGARRSTKLRFGFPVEQVKMTDLLERPCATQTPVIDNTVSLDFTPFEIKTFCIHRAN